VNEKSPSQPSLTVDGDLRQPASVSVNVCNLNPDLMVSLRRHLQTGGPLQSILRVNVVRTRAPIDDDFPDIFGRYHVLEDGVRFIPHFPFERGLSYRASFDLRPLGRPERAEARVLAPEGTERLAQGEAYLPLKRQDQVDCRFPIGSVIWLGIPIV
jgi:hypothetical protein